MSEKPQSASFVTSRHRPVHVIPHYWLVNHGASLPFQHWWPQGTEESPRDKSFVEHSAELRNRNSTEHAMDIGTQKVELPHATIEFRNTPAPEHASLSGQEVWLRKSHSKHFSVSAMLYEEGPLETVTCEPTRTVE